MFDGRTTCLVVVGAQWGDEGKGKLVDVLAERADLVVRYQGGANAGPHGRHRRHPVHPAADPLRHSPPARHLRGGQRRGARARDLLRRAGPARRAGHLDRRQDLRVRPRPPGASLPQAARRREREEPEARDHGTRHRPGLRGQVRPPRHPCHRPPAPGVRPDAAGRPGAAGQPAAGDDGLAGAGLVRPARRAARAARAPAPAARRGRRPSGAPRRARGKAGAARGRPGFPARRGSRHLSLRHLVEHDRRRGRRWAPASVRR